MQELDSLAAAIAGTVPSIVLLLDRQGGIEYGNPCFERLSGYSLDEVRGEDFVAQFLPEGGRSRMRRFLGEVASDRVVLSGVHAILTREGHPVDVEWCARLHRRREGETHILCIGDPTTAASDAELQCRSYRQVLLHMAEGVYFADEGGAIVFTNPALDQMFGYAPGELLGKQVAVLSSVSPKERQRLESIVALEVARVGYWEGECENRRKDGATFPASASVAAPTPVDVAPEVFGGVRWVGIQRDLTEHKRAEIRARAFRREKETLLREVHHRVKNNLQVISSLLHFHAKRVSDARDIEAFDDARKRLLSMMLVHETLYQSEHLSRVNMADYVPSLLSMLADSFDGNEVALEVSVDDLQLSIDTAVPCGMLLSELVSNAFKHAFPDRSGGRLGVNVQRSGDKVVVVVDDDGVGLPRNIDPYRVNSFGWQLTRMLTQQLNGELKVQSAAGTQVTVSFPGPGEERRA